MCSGKHGNDHGPEPGRRVAVILDINSFDRLVDHADDVEDRRELAAARIDDDYVPWDDVKAGAGPVVKLDAHSTTGAPPANPADRSATLNSTKPSLLAILWMFC